MKHNGLKFWLQLLLLLAGLWMGVTGVWQLRDNFTSLFPGIAKQLGYAVDGSIYYCMVSFEGAQRIGDTWEGVQAEDGYSFYKLQYTITNMGDRYYYTDCPSLYYTGDKYDDIIEYWDWEKETDESDSPFEYYETPRIPVGRTAAAYDVIQVRDGVTEFEVSYYPNYKDDTKEVFLKISLE